MVTPAAKQEAVAHLCTAFDMSERRDNPKPFTWTADPDRIVATVRRGHQVLGSV